MNTTPYITWEALQDYSCHSKFYYVFWNTLLTTIHFLAATLLVYHPLSSTCPLFLNLPMLPLWKNTRISTKLIVRAMAGNSVLAPELFPYANCTDSGSVLYYFFPPVFQYILVFAKIHIVYSFSIKSTLAYVLLPSFRTIRLHYPCLLLYEHYNAIFLTT